MKILSFSKTNRISKHHCSTGQAASRTSAPTSMKCKTYSTSNRWPRHAKRWSTWWRTCPLPLESSTIPIIIDLRSHFSVNHTKVEAVVSSRRTSDYRAVSQGMIPSPNTKLWAREWARCPSIRKFMSSQKIIKDLSRRQEGISTMHILTILLTKCLTI